MAIGHRACRPMTFKIVYTKGTVMTSAIVEGSTIKDALRKGYQHHQWDCILEITTPDNLTIQGKV
jgi:hypothetical protein